jgi:hypothetical protein
MADSGEAFGLVSQDEARPDPHIRSPVAFKIPLQSAIISLA